jgi:hypothetical protein
VIFLHGRLSSIRTICPALFCYSGLKFYFILLQQVRDFIGDLRGAECY